MQPISSLPNGSLRRPVISSAFTNPSQEPRAISPSTFTTIARTPPTAIPHYSISTIHLRSSSSATFSGKFGAVFGSLFGLVFLVTVWLYYRHRSIFTKGSSPPPSSKYPSGTSTPRPTPPPSPARRHSEPFSGHPLPSFEPPPQHPPDSSRAREQSEPAKNATLEPGDGGKTFQAANTGKKRNAGGSARAEQPPFDTTDRSEALESRAGGAGPSHTSDQQAPTKADMDEGSLSQQPETQTSLPSSEGVTGNGRNVPCQASTHASGSPQPATGKSTKDSAGSSKTSSPRPKGPRAAASRSTIDQNTQSAKEATARLPPLQEETDQAAEADIRQPSDVTDAGDSPQQSTKFSSPVRSKRRQSKGLPAAAPKLTIYQNTPLATDATAQPPLQEETDQAAEAEAEADIGQPSIVAAAGNPPQHSMRLPSQPRSKRRQSKSLPAAASRSPSEQITRLPAEVTIQPPPLPEKTDQAADTFMWQPSDVTDTGILSGHSTRSLSQPRTKRRQSNNRVRPPRSNSANTKSPESSRRHTAPPSSASAAMSHRPAPSGHVDLRGSRFESTIEGPGGSKSIGLSLRSSSSSHRSTSSGVSSKSLSSEEVESLQRAFSPSEISISPVHSEIERHQSADYAEVRSPSVVPEGPVEEIPHISTGFFDGELFESPDSDLSSDESYVSANEPASGEKEGSNTTSDRPRPRRHGSTAYSARTYPIRTATGRRSSKIHSVPASEGGPDFYQIPSTEPGVTIELRKPTTSDSPNSMYYSPPTFQYQKPMRPVTYLYGQRALYRDKKPAKSTQDPAPPPPEIVTPDQPVSGPSQPPALEVESPPGSTSSLHARPVANASSFLLFIAGQRSAKRTFLKPNP